MENNYLTDTELETIRFWPKDKGFHNLMAYTKNIWIYPGYFQENKMEKETIYKISTGGWSGHEEIIDALNMNHFFWMECWYSSRRGGHYMFKVEKNTGDK